MFTSKRTFGIELELALPTQHTREQFQMGRYHGGIGITGSPKSSRGGVWKAERDASLQGFSANLTALEVVSPILKGEDGLIDTLVFVDYLNEIGAQSNASCGIHIHVDVKDMTAKQKDKFVKMFCYFEKMFFALNGSHTAIRWFNGHYCLTSDNWTQQYPSHDVPVLMRTRYQCLNWQKMPSTGTIEFRLFSGNLISNRGAIIGAIMYAVKMADFIKENPDFDLDTLPTGRRTVTELHETFLGLIDIDRKDADDVIGVMTEQVRMGSIF